MLHLYDLAHNKIEGLNKYKDYKIERTLDGIEFLSFSYPFKFAENIKEETYIRTKKNEYVVKEIDDSSECVNIVAKINLDEIKGKAIDRIDVTNTSLVDAVNLAIAGTGYTATILGNKVKRRTVRKAKCSSYEVLEEIRKVYKVEYKFDTINKVIYIYDSMGEDKGSYFSDELNLRKLSIKSNTYDFATRIIPLGKDGLTIESINNGKNYVENYQYSNKIITVYWEDNRYTDAESLMEDATLKLDEISKRVVAYDTDIIDLANASKDKRYKVLDYDLGDTVTLKSREKKVKEKQRIVKITEYPDEPWLNSCEIANRVLKFEDMQREVIESAEVVDNITNSDGSIDGSSIDEIKVEKIKNFEAEIIRVTNLDVVNANISNLVANKADIVDLNAAKARIGTLEVTKATITDLNAANAKITTLEADTAKITDLNATNAKINILEVDSASIQNLLAGNITASNMQSGSITAGSGIIADGAIGNAQISSLKVDKLESGIFSTSKFTVQGENGRLKIHNNLLQVFSGSSGQFERVALGDINKDGTEYGLRVRGADGTTVLLNENGLTNKGFTDGYEKLADSQLDPKKIDIDKVVTTVNNGVTQINSSKIQVGNKSLEVELSERKIKETEFETNISNNTSSITANTNKIALKLDSQDFTQYKTLNDNNLSTINTNLSKATTDISVMQGEINLKASKTEVSTVSSKIDEAISESTTIINNKVAEIKLTTDSIKLDVSSNTSNISKKTDKTYVDGQISTVNTAITNVSNKASSLETNLNDITGRVSSAETNITTINGNITSLNTRLNTAELKITPTAITSTVESNTTALAKSADLNSLKTRVTTAESTIVQQADQIASKVNKNGVISEINQTSEAIKINASKINLVGAVTVLSDLTSTNNLGTVNAGRLYGPNIDVNLNAGTIDITNGAFRLKNNLGQVIIDGNSKMFRIAREMTLTVDAGTSNDYTGNWRHHLGYVPAFVAYQTGFPSGSGLSGSIELPAMSVGIGTAQALYIGSMLRVSVNETNVYVNYIRSDRSKYSRYATVKIYLYSEALI